MRQGFLLLFLPAYCAGQGAICDALGGLLDGNICSCTRTDSGVGGNVQCGFSMPPEEIQLTSSVTIPQVSIAYGVEIKPCELSVALSITYTYPAFFASALDTCARTANLASCRAYPL